MFAIIVEIIYQFRILNLKLQALGGGLEGFTVDQSELYEGLDSEYDYMTMLKMAKTSDKTDIFEMLRPDDGDLSLYGHHLEDLVVQCSFNREDCDM